MSELIPKLAPFLWIDGQFQKPVNGTTFETARPATGELLTEVANATKEDVDIAVQAAKRCLYSDGWGYKSTGKQRADILRKFATIMEARSYLTLTLT